MNIRLIAALVLAALAGCVNQGALVRRRAAFDLSCAGDQLLVSELTDRAFGVTGCGRKATYIVQGGCQFAQPCVPVLNSPPENAPR